MKIGIVTYHRTLNYGAVMQSLATRFILEEMGHEVYYVDYWPDYHRSNYELFPLSEFIKYGLKQKMRFLMTFLKSYKSKKRRIDNFEKFFQTHIYPFCRPIDDSYDVVIYGSDQIWRKQKALGAYNPFYFGENDIKAQHHISYAASMGILPDNDADRAKVKELVSHLEKISVREEGLRQLLLSLGYKDVMLSLDPTLLLNSDGWDKYLPTEPYNGKRYVLVYMFNADVFDLEKIKKFANERCLKLIVLRGYTNTKESESNVTSAGPYEFVRLIKNADYVFTASFHGLVFSILYRKQFYTSFKSNAERAESLLHQLGVYGRILSPQSAIPHDTLMIDYEEINKKLSVLRKESLKFLNISYE